MNDHSGHERLLAQVSAGDVSEDSEEFLAAINGCPSCRDEWNTTRAAREELAAAREAMDADLAEAKRRGAVTGEEKVYEIVRSLADGSSNRSRPNRQYQGRWPALALIAAALLIGASVSFFDRSDPESTVPPITLSGHASLRCIGPAGAVSDFRVFRWEGKLPASHWYEVIVRSPDGHEVFRSTRLESNEFSPTDEQEADLGDQIEWEIQERSVAGLIDSDIRTAHRLE